MDAFAGIDVAFARGKPLPVCICVRRAGRLEPLRLRDRPSPEPPRGHGNPATLREPTVRAFADATARYLHDVEQQFKVRIRRVAIDAPSDPKRLGMDRRLAEVALDERHVSCITTPDAAQFAAIRAKAAAYLADGGAVARMPHANQLWMLAGFALFERLREDWECLEVYPQATVAALGAGGVHKSKAEGLQAQLAAVASRTGWPDPAELEALRAIGYGRRDDRLDAYMAAWVASLGPPDRKALGTPPDDAIWIPRLKC